MCDKGTINDIPVIDVLEKEDEIVHVIDSDIAGEEVKGNIDWNHRFENMQQHTGQHTLSQSFIRLFDAYTISSTLGSTTCTVDIFKEKLNDNEIDDVENLANKIVFENRIVKTYYPDTEQLQQIPLRKKPPEGKKTRIVEVENFDYSACGGTHCKSTGEVGIIKVRRWERYKSNVRVEFQCGIRALRDYQQKNRTINMLIDRFSEQESELLNKADKILDDNKDLRKKCTHYLGELQEFEAAGLFDRAEVIRNLRVIRKTYEKTDVNDVRNIALKLKNRDHCVSLFGIEGEKGHLIFSASENSEVDAGKLLGKVLEKTGGKGGGGKFFAQGGCDTKEVKSAIEFAGKLLLEYS